MSNVVEKMPGVAKELACFAVTAKELYAKKHTEVADWLLDRIGHVLERLAEAGTPESPEIERASWMPYVGTEQLLIGRFAKFGIDPKNCVRTVLLKNATIFNGEVLPVDHLWIKNPPDAFGAIQRGSVIMGIGEIQLYTSGGLQKVGIGQLRDIRVLQAGNN